MAALTSSSPVTALYRCCLSWPSGPCFTTRSADGCCRSWSLDGVFNGGSALGRSIWSNDDTIRSGWRNHDQVVRIAARGGPFPALMIARTAEPVGAQDVDVRFTVCGLGSD